MPRGRLGLSGKLLLLTIPLVMIAEVLIYVPSIANFRANWLHDRLSAAYTAALVLDAAPSGMVPESLARQILDSVGARAVAMKMGQQRRLLAVAE
ncbi:MAG: sensor histidine kinase, partial [Afipia sp.]|nr:sensor histidine kinase [Afipia sp.]